MGAGGGRETPLLLGSDFQGAQAPLAQPPAVPFLITAPALLSRPGSWPAGPSTTPHFSLSASLVLQAALAALTQRSLSPLEVGISV